MKQGEAEAEGMTKPFVFTSAVASAVTCLLRPATFTVASTLAVSCIHRG